MAVFEIRVGGIDEVFRGEGKSAEEAARSVLGEIVSKYPDQLEWDVTVVAGGRYQCRMVGIKDIEGGAGREIEVSITRIG